MNSGFEFPKIIYMGIFIMKRSDLWTALIGLLMLLSGEVHTKGVHSSEVGLKAPQSSDIVIVNNPKKPVPEPGSRKKLVFEEIRTIGEKEGDENYMFGDSLEVSMDEEGSYYVTDWDRKRIQKYSSEGEYLLSIGRQGEGPGEFGNIWTPKFDREGNIYARDIANNKVVFFTRKGEHIKDIRIDSDVGDIHILPDGNYFTYKTENIEEAGVSRYVHVYGVYNPELDLISELHRDYQNLPSRGNKSWAEFIAGILSAGAFKPVLNYHVTEEGLIYTGFSEKYDICIYSQEGTLLKIINRKFDRVKVNQKHRDDFFDTQSEIFMQRINADDSLRNDIRRFMKYPKYLPAYRSFSLMDNGWLFVVRDAVGEDLSLVDLFDENGLFVGQFESHIPHFGLQFKNGKAFAAVTIDDYKYVKIYSYTFEDY